MMKMTKRMWGRLTQLGALLLAGWDFYAAIELLIEGKYISVVANAVVSVFFIIVLINVEKRLRKTSE